MSNKTATTRSTNIAETASEDTENVKNNNVPSPASGVPLDFNLEIYEHLTLAQSQRTSTTWLLKKAAETMRARKALPPMLADYIADAFDVAVAKPTAHQARALTEELHLTSRSRRPAHSWIIAGQAMFTLVAAGVSKTKAKVIVAVEYDIDERTALKYFKMYSQAKKQHDNIE